MSRAALLILAVATAGCWELLPASKDPVSDAAHREPRVCPATEPVYPPEVFNPQWIVSVAPLYFDRDEHGNQQAHLLGATLVVRPIPGLSSQDLERLLSCHAVRSQLQRQGEPLIANDPYWAPGYATRITVDFEEGTTSVQIESRDFEGAKAILERAQAFVHPAG